MLLLKQSYSNAEKAEVWVKVAEAYLENDETDAADNFCSKVSHSIQSVRFSALVLLTSFLHLLYHFIQTGRPVAQAVLWLTWKIRQRYCL